MKQGWFCFIQDRFYEQYDTEHKLMRNKETIDNKVHARPCFYAFEDVKNPTILWCVPVSSKIDKYIKIQENKLARQKEHGITHPKNL